MDMRKGETGMDLAVRKSALTAIGWEFRKDYGPYAVWGAYMPNGQVYFVEFSLDRVMQSCPAVESSVDAAMLWLTLPDGYYWVNQGPYNGIWWARIDRPNYPIAVAGVEHPSLATAMCKAYEEMKVGNETNQRS